MKKLSGNEIRTMWLDFFKSKGHSIEKSANLIPNNDKSLLWINAGVSPLKKYFDGSVKPKNPRMTNAQKCIRTNDIDNVGRTSRHHTFFEMLGNFSIGDYFKEDVIPWAFELLTSKKYFDFSKNDLYITYYTEDTETKDLWVKEGMDESHMVPLDGNFWEIGEGPCGPDTEIFFDRGTSFDERGIELLEKDIDNERYVEIWNIVFSQFNSKSSLKRSEYPELPSKNIDTGSGLERLACVMQGTRTNFETDLFMPLINKISEISGVEYKGQMAFKVIADHVRTVVFAISDGASLSNEGRGYVLRRVLRRATKYAGTLGINKAFMSELVPVVIESMGEFYPVIKEQEEICKKIITSEEEKFLSTLKKGEQRFMEIASQSGDVISGKDAFTLYDTFGFPIELTSESALELGKKVDMDGFKVEMQAQKERARNARSNDASFSNQNSEFMAFSKKSIFIGYNETSSNSEVIAVFGDSIVLDKTPFYAFSGGQLSDSGTINDIQVTDVKKMPNGQHLHTLANNNFSVGDKVVAKVDTVKRDLTRKNHSSAHLLQAALKKVLGEHVSQKGSQVSDEYCRFDFNNYDAITNEQLFEIEKTVNNYIKEAHPVITNVMSLDEAKSTGATALFDEKYGSKVRVVDMQISKEFCAGTHVSNTKDIEKFYITESSSIGSGIFRITAVTGPRAYDLLEKSTKNLDSEITALNKKAEQLISDGNKKGFSLELKPINYYNNVEGYSYVLKKRETIVDLGSSIKDLEKEFTKLSQKQALSDLDSYGSLIESKAIITTVNLVDSNLIKDLAKALQNKYSLRLVLLVSVSEPKVTFVCATDKSINAGQVVREAAKITKGGGGGKLDLAQAGGKDSSKLDEALEYVKGLL